MTENIHFNDDIFFLKMMVGHLTSALKLKVDPELFSEKICEDILFLDQTIQKLYSALQKNSHLIKMNDYLHHLMKLKGEFAGLLKQFLEIDRDHFPEIHTFRPQMTRALEIHEQNILEIQAVLRNKEENMAQKDIISYDELNFLMAPGLGGEEEES